MSRHEFYWIECDFCHAYSPAMQHPTMATAAAQALGWAFLCKWVGQKNVKSVEYCPRCRNTPECLEAMDDTKEIRHNLDSPPAAAIEKQEYV